MFVTSEKDISGSLSKKRDNSFTSVKYDWQFDSYDVYNQQFISFIMFNKLNFVIDVVVSLK